MIHINIHNWLNIELHEKWDPIGVHPLLEGNIVQYREYTGYVFELYNLFLDKNDTESVFDLLWKFETESMGLSGQKEKTAEFAKYIRREFDKLKNII